MVFTDIQATQACFPDYLQQTYDRLIKETTLAYDPTVISSLGWKSTAFPGEAAKCHYLIQRVTYSDLYYNESSPAQSCNVNDTVSQLNYVKHNPLLVMDASLHRPAPEWQTCINAGPMVFDPSRALQKVDALTSATQPSAIPITEASPGSRMSPSDAAATSPPVVPVSTQAAPSPPGQTPQTAPQDPPLPTPPDPNPVPGIALSVDPAKATAAPSNAVQDPAAQTPTPKADPAGNNAAQQNPVNLNPATQNPALKADPAATNVAQQPAQQNSALQNPTTQTPAPKADPAIINAAPQSSPIQDPAAQNPAAGLQPFKDPNQITGGAAGVINPVDPAFTAAGQTFTANPAGLAIASTVISAGGQGIMVSGTPISVLPSNLGIAVGGNTVAMPASFVPGVVQNPNQNTGGSPGHNELNKPAFIAAGQTFTPNPAGFAIASTTISAGGPGIVVSGTPISILPSGGGVAVGDSTIIVPPSLGPGAAQNPNQNVGVVPGAGVAQPGFTAGGQTFTANPAGGFAAGGTIISAGGQALTISGTPVSILPGGGGIAVSGGTIPLPAANSQIFTAAGQTFSANLAGGFVAGVTTLDPGGPALTILGTLVSLLPNKGGIVVGSSTVALPTDAAKGFTVAGQTFTANSAGGFATAGTTINAGGQGLTISGTPISILPNNQGVAVGGSTIPMPTNAPQGFTVAGQTFAAVASGFAVGGSTISPGGPGITIAGTPISILSNGGGVAVGGSTIALPISSQKPFTIAGQMLTPVPSGFAVGGTTISANGPGATVSGTPISVLPNNGGVVIGSSTIPLPTSAQIAIGQTITAAGQTLTAVPGGFAVGGTTLSANGPAAMISGTPISILPNNAGVVIGTSTISLPTSAQTITTAGQTLTLLPSGLVAVAGTTISANGPAATISGTPISVLPNSAGLLVGTSTIPLASLTSAGQTITTAGQTLTLLPSGRIAVAGTTLMPNGPAATISGTTVSLGPDGKLKVGTAVITILGTQTGGVGGAIMSGFGGTTSAGASTVTGAGAGTGSGGSTSTGQGSASASASAKPSLSQSSNLTSKRRALRIVICASVVLVMFWV